MFKNPKIDSQANGDRVSQEPAPSRLFFHADRRWFGGGVFCGCWWKEGWGLHTKGEKRRGRGEGRGLLAKTQACSNRVGACRQAGRQASERVSVPKES